MNSIPHESQLTNWKERIVERKGQTCYAETPSGKFSLSSIQNMLKIHEIKNIKAAVDAISEDTAQKIQVDTNGKHNSSSVHKSSKPQSEFQPNKRRLQ